MTKKAKSKVSKAKTPMPDGGKSSTDHFFTINQAWAKALTMPALLNAFRRYLDDPKGWTKNQKKALFEELYQRTALLATFTEVVMVEVQKYMEIPDKPVMKKHLAARDLAAMLTQILDDAFPS